MTEIQVEVQSETSGTQKLANNKEIIAHLAEKFPLCFTLEGEAKPLKIGLFQDLAEALKDDERVSKTQLRHALRQYTSNWRYLHGCRAGAARVDLEGNPVGEVDQQHAEHAARQLAEAKARLAEKRAAERAANPKANKKRPPRSRKSVVLNGVKVENGEKKTVAKARKPKPELTAVDFASLQKGSKVKVKVAEHAKSATVLDIVKEGARVELDNGLVLTVDAARLFA